MIVWLLVVGSFTGPPTTSRLEIQNVTEIQLIKEVHAAVANNQSLASPVPVLENGIRTEVTYLYIAAKRNFNMATKLILNHSTSRDRSALNVAVSEGHVSIVAALLNRDWGGTKNDTVLEIALHHALIDNRIDIANLFVDHGVPLTFPILAGLGRMTDVQRVVESNPSLTNDGQALRLACATGQTAIVEYILNHCKEPDRLASESLSTAARHGHLAIVRHLLEQEADINYRDGFARCTALTEACTTGQIQVAKLLIERGANPDLTAGLADETPLHLATKGGNRELVELLLNHATWGVDHRTASLRLVQIPAISLEFPYHYGIRWGWTALHYAAENGDEDIASILLDAGATMDRRADFGEAPLHIAIIFKQFHFAEFLLNRGAHGDIRDEEGRSVLFYLGQIRRGEHLTPEHIQKIDALDARIRKAAAMEYGLGK